MGKKSSLEGIKFADEGALGAEPVSIEDDWVASPPPKGADPVAVNTANQTAARGVIERMKHLDIANFPSTREELPQVSKDQAAQMKPKVYIVLKDRSITRGAGGFLLREGKYITENDYSIADLRRQGVQLDEVRSE